jgi:hypothetical protein
VIWAFFLALRKCSGRVNKYIESSVSDFSASPSGADQKTGTSPRTVRPVAVDSHTIEDNYKAGASPWNEIAMFDIKTSQLIRCKVWANHLLHTWAVKGLHRPKFFRWAWTFFWCLRHRHPSSTNTAVFGNHESNHLILPWWAIIVSCSQLKLEIHLILVLLPRFLFNSRVYLRLRYPDESFQGWIWRWQFTCPGGQIKILEYSIRPGLGSDLLPVPFKLKLSVFQGSNFKFKFQGFYVPISIHRWMLLLVVLVLVDWLYFHCQDWLMRAEEARI